jgi:hypothetical protein
MKIMLKLLAITLMLISLQSIATVYHQPKNYDQVGYCCYRPDGTFMPQSTIRWNDDFANEWPRYGVTNEGKVGFSDISEQPLISGFERSVYNTPK